MPSVQVPSHLPGVGGGGPRDGCNSGAVGRDDQVPQRNRREETVLAIDYDEVEARERRELDDAGNGPREETADESFFTALDTHRRSVIPEEAISVSHQLSAGELSRVQADS